MTTTLTSLSQDQHDSLEAMIDAATLAQVLEALACVASAKADHIREAWQDHHTAANWEDACTALLRASLNSDVCRVSGR